MTSRTLAVAATALSLAGLAGCSKGSSLAGLIDIAPPAGYSLNDGGSGSLDRSHAAAAMPYTVTDDAKGELKKVHYKRGNVKVWTKGTAFATAAAFRLGNAADATSLADYQRSSIKGQGDTAYISDSPPVKGASVFVVSGVAKQDQRGLFCQGLFFVRKDIFYVTTTCDSAAPASTVAATSLAKQLDAKAAK